MRRTLAVTALSTAFVGLTALPAKADVISPYGVTFHSAPECIFENNSVILRVTPQTDEINAPAIKVGITDPEYSPDPVWTVALPGENVLNYRQYAWERMELPWDNAAALIQKDVVLTVYYAWTIGLDDQGRPIIWDVSENLPEPCSI